MISPMFVTVSEASRRTSDDIILSVCIERPDDQLFLALTRGRLMRLFSWMGGRHARKGRDGLI